MTDDNPCYLYCAGLYEGEGTIHFNFTGKSRALSLAIHMTDREPLDLFEDIMQVGTVYGPYAREMSKNKARKPSYMYRVSNYDEVKSVIDRMYDWLSPRRKRQADEALTEYLKYGPPRTYKKRGG